MQEHDITSNCVGYVWAPYIPHYTSISLTKELMEFLENLSIDVGLCLNNINSDFVGFYITHGCQSLFSFKGARDKIYLSYVAEPNGTVKSIAIFYQYVESYPVYEFNMGDPSFGPELVAEAISECYNAFGHDVLKNTT